MTKAQKARNRDFESYNERNIKLEFLILVRIGQSGSSENCTRETRRDIVIIISFIY